MSYQVNFKLHVFNCSKEELEIVQELRKELELACALVLEAKGLSNSMAVGSPEFSYLKL